MSPTVDGLVAEYLTRLDRAAAVLPDDERRELVHDIRAHLVSAHEAGARDEASVRTVLDRLGLPEEIVAGAQAAAGRGAGPVPTAPGAGWGAGAEPASRRRGTGLELAAVLLLTAGSLVPVLGWLVGVGLLWASPLWRVREKLLGTLVVPFGPGLALGAGPFFATRTETCTSEPVLVDPDAQPGSVVDDVMTCTTSGLDGATALVLTVLVLVAPVVVAVVLHRTAVRRAAAR